MTIIPKEEIEAKNALRYTLLVEKNNVVAKVLEVRKTQKDFYGTDEQIAALKDGDLSALISEVVGAKEKAEEAAKKIDASGIWFDDIQRMVVTKEEAEEKKRKAEENAE